jgi:uroporphyrinogen decarboxylase
MNSIERVKTLLSKRIPDRMGLFDHLWPETIPDYWAAQGYPKETAPEFFFDYDMALYGEWINTEPFPRNKDILEQTDRWEVYRDGRGATLKRWKSKSGTPEHIGFDVTTPEKWKKYREPLLALDPSRFDKFENYQANLEKSHAAGKFVVFGHGSVFEHLRSTIGDEHFLPSMIMEPDWIQDFCRVYVDFFIRHYEHLFRNGPMPDGYWIYEDMGYRNGLFCSPAMLRDMIMPHERRLVDFFKSYKLPVLLHTCGNVMEALSVIIETGFDCLQPMEAKAGMNVVEIAKIYGSKIAYMGNIDVTVLSTNDREKVKGEIVPKLKAMKEMRVPYFFHSDHSIPPSIDLSTYQYALELYRSNSTY